MSKRNRNQYQRPRRLPWWVWTTAAGAIIGLALYGSAARAHADPIDDEAAALKISVCSTLDDYPSVAGVLGVMDSLTDHGATAHQAAGVVVAAITQDCPRHIGLLAEFGSQSQAA